MLFAAPRHLPTTSLLTSTRAGAVLSKPPCVVPRRLQPSTHHTSSAFAEAAEAGRTEGFDLAGA